jgi:aerobic C4-dicarboxylate transport protein
VRLLRQLWFQVLIAMAVGILLGHFWPTVGAAMKPFGDAFIGLVRMVIAPIIFCTVVHGIASMHDMKRVGRLALKSLGYFLVITLFALLFALVAVNLWRPGEGMNIDPAALDTSGIATYTTQAQQTGIVPFLLNIIPSTFVSAFTEGHVLQVLLVSLLFAAALSAMGERGRPVLDFLDNVAQVFFRIVAIIMRVAPLGAFGALAFTVARFGAGSLLSLGELLLEFYVVCFLFVFLVLGTVARWVGVRLTRLLYYFREELLIVAATTSSETVLPRLLEKLRRLGCEKTVVGFVIPTGYSFNLDGTCLYLATAVIFLAQATNTDLSIAQQLGLMAVLLLTSKGAAGVAGAAFVVLAATLASVGTVPVASIALILGIHRSMAEALTFVNVAGNCVATLVIAKWENALDRDKLHAELAAPLRLSLQNAK